MLRITPIAERIYIPPFDDAIDFDSWSEEAQKGYFVDNFDLPPIKQGETPSKFVLKQLTGEDINNLIQIQAQNSGLIFSNDWIEYVIRHGIKDWSGLYLGDKEIKPKFDNGVLTKESYLELLPFSQQFLIVLGASIYKASVL